MARQSANPRALQGVNLGGWLILERWMTPKVFEGTDAIDEYTFMQTPGAKQKLRAHQQEFIKDEDFKWMAKNGVELVRIPVGYWIFDGDGPFIPCIGKLDWAFAAAKKYGIKVLISFHGAEGSQNGRDHSGRIGKARWYETVENRRKSVTTLRRLAERYRNEPALWGIQLLNEPRTKIFQRKLKKFYNAAYRELGRVVKPGTRIVYHDAFTPRMLSAAVWDDKRYPVLMDIHWYHFAFMFKKLMPLSWYMRFIIPWHGRLIHRLQRSQGIIIGEWNGIIAGEKLDTFPKDQHAGIVKQHIDAQLKAYATADAWCYWNYKTEARGVWHFRSLVEDGVFNLKPRQQ